MTLPYTQMLALTPVLPSPWVADVETAREMNESLVKLMLKTKCYQCFLGPVSKITAAGEAGRQVNR